MNQKINKTKSPFQMPTALKITGRSSTITNLFINSIIPVVTPSDEEIETALQILGMSKDSVCCSYCGDPATEWDHLHPLVKDKKPTGYISEIHNLVPSCGKCNQSKGNKEWKTWILSDAALSPTSRGKQDVLMRIERIEAYEKWGNPRVYDFQAIVNKENWDKHMRNCEKIQELLRESQFTADLVKNEIASKYKTFDEIK